MDLTEIGVNTRIWFDSAQDRIYWRALVNSALTLRIPEAMELVNYSINCSVCSYFIIHSVIIVHYISMIFWTARVFYSSIRFAAFKFPIYVQARENSQGMYSCLNIY